MPPRRPPAKKAPAPAPAAPSAAEIDVIVAAAAKKWGIPPGVLEATADVESTDNPNAAAGGAYGLFQEQKGGELDSYSHGSIALAKDPAHAADVAAMTIAQARQANPGVSWGQAVMIAQRPKGYVPGHIPAATEPYASKIDAIIGGGGTVTGKAAAPTTQASPGTGGNSAVAAYAPVAGANVKNFHGFDLSAIPTALLGRAERAITDGIAQGTVNPALDEAKLQSEFPNEQFLLSDSQVRGVIVAATAASFGENELLGALRNTSWWTKNNQNQRDYQEALSNDPATAHQAVQEAQAKVIDTAHQLGVRLTAAEVNNISSKVASFSFTQRGVIGGTAGLTDQQLTQMVTSYFNYRTQTTAGAGGQPTVLSGEAGTLFDSFQKMAGQYLVNDVMTPDKIGQFVQDQLKGYTGQGGFEAGAQSAFETTVKQLAASKYGPVMQDAIARGIDPSTYVAPYASEASKVLGVDSNSVDFTDPQWRTALTATDPSSGAPTGAPMTMDQWDKYLRSTTFNVGGQQLQWQNTLAGQNAQNDLVASIGQMFGKTPSGTGGF